LCPPRGSRRSLLEDDALNDVSSSLTTTTTRPGCEREANGVSQTPDRKEAEMDILKGIRPLDYVLTAALVALAAFIGLENVNAGADVDVAHALDSHSALMVPVFVIAALPILWRRSNILAAVGASFVIVAASVPMFGWVTRCGWALPLSIAMAYAVARFAGSKQNHLIGLVGILALQIVTLMKDSSTGGLGALALSVPAAAVFYGIGWFVQTRAEKSAAEPTLSVERVHA
jgi:hypothetical protein